MNDAGDIFWQGAGGAATDAWVWIPLAAVVVYVLIRNNSWQKLLIHLTLFGLLFAVTRWADGWWGEERSSVVGFFFAGSVLLACLVRSKQLAFALLATFIGLFCLAPQDVRITGEQFMQGLLLGSMACVADSLLVGRILKEEKRYVSVEFTESGYAVSHVEVLELFLFLTWFAVLCIGLYEWIGEVKKGWQI